eukprot:2697916-Pyramimonas_sp.AAC.1
MFTDGGHLSIAQQMQYFHRGTLVVCARCYKAGRAPRRDPPQRSAEASGEHRGEQRKLRGI